MHFSILVASQQQMSELGNFDAELTKECVSEIGNEAHPADRRDRVVLVLDNIKR